MALSRSWTMSPTSTEHAVLRLIAAMVVLTAVGAFVRWLWRKISRRAAAKHTAQAAARQRLEMRLRFRALFASTVTSLLIGMGIVLVLFLVRLVHLELTQHEDSQKLSSPS